MANTLDGGSFKEVWSRTMQMFNEKLDVFRAIANFSEQQNLKEGDVLNKPRRSAMTPQDYTRGTAVTIQDLTNTNESLTVDQAVTDPFYVDDLDELQSSYQNLKEYAQDAAIDLGNEMDGDVLGEFDQANSDVDNSDIASGTAGDGFTLTTSNILKTFSLTKKKLKKLNIFHDLFGVISPDFEATLMEFLAGKDTALGDSTGINGHIGRYYGFDLFVSNSGGWSGSLGVATNPTDGDTVVINGVTFTFKDVIGTTAGNVHIASDAANTVDILVASVNAPGTTVTEATDDGFVALSQANQDLLRNITATDGTTAMTLKSEGKSNIAVSETLTASADLWTLALQIQHQLFGKKGAIHMIVQKFPTVEVKSVQDKIGNNVIPWILYGLKTFNNDKDKLVDVNIRSDAF